MNELQTLQLEILQEFSKVVEKHDLTWFAMFGTLLGAVRHKGFIPWDDDIDVAMPRADYDRLRLSEGWFNEPLFLQTPQNDPEAAPRYIKLRRSDTTYIERYPTLLTRGGNMGICIDIFPLDDVPGATSAGTMHNAAQKVHYQMLASAALDENAGSELPDHKAEICYSMGGVAGLYSILAERYEWICSRYTNKPYYTIPVLAGTRGTWVFDKKWFSDTEEKEFEGIKIPVPVGWSEVLVASYPEGLHEPERIPGKPIQEEKDVIIDAKNSYTTYTSRYTDMLKDIESRHVYLFGAGDSLHIWLERYSKGLDIACVFDNSRDKWGSTAFGLPVKSPDELPSLLNENSRLIITSIYHKEISKQLDNLNIGNYYIFIDGWNYIH